MPYYGFYGIDMYYIVLVVPCIILAFWAQARVKSTFNRYSQVLNRRGLTGAQAALPRTRQGMRCSTRSDISPSVCARPLFQ